MVVVVVKIRSGLHMLMLLRVALYPFFAGPEEEIGGNRIFDREFRKCVPGKKDF